MSEALGTLSLKIAGRGPAAPAQTLVRTAVKDGRQVVVLRSVQNGGGSLIECEVRPVNAPSIDPLKLGPYTFRTVDEARMFLDETALALEYLGCEVTSE